MSETESRLEFLNQFLAERDLPCPLCAYNLRGLTSGACPECGSEVELSVGLSEPRMGAFVTGAVGLASGLGFNTFILGWFLWMSAMRATYGPRLADGWPLFVGLAVTGYAMFLWLRRRRKIRLMRSGVRWALAAACFVVSLATAILFFSVVR